MPITNHYRGLTGGPDAAAPSDAAALVRIADSRGAEPAVSSRESGKRDEGDTHAADTGEASAVV